MYRYEHRPKTQTAVLIKLSDTNTRSFSVSYQVGRNMESEPNLVPYLIILLLLLFASVFALFVYSGLFTKIIIRAGPPSFGSVRIAYKFARGPYKNAGQLFTEAHCLAPDFQTIGIYYDDPQQVNSVSSLSSASSYLYS